MKKATLLFVMLAIVLSCCSCGWFGEQRYFCDVENVKSVQIVQLGEYIEEEYRFEFNILSTISNFHTFIERLNNVDHRVNWGDPLLMDMQSVAIKIEYQNGDFDLLQQNSQIFHRLGENHYGFFFFDGEEFLSLISDYTKSPSIPLPHRS